MTGVGRLVVRLPVSCEVKPEAVTDVQCRTNVLLLTLLQYTLLGSHVTSLTTFLS